MTAVESLRHMTDAMKRVAAARTRKCRNRLEEIRPYCQGLERVMSLLTLRHGLQHPLLQPRAIVKDVVILVGSDRGLCGAYNLDMVKGFSALDHPPPAISRQIIVCGAKLGALLKKANVGVGKIFPLPKMASVEETSPLAKELAAGYLDDSYQRVMIVRMHEAKGGGRQVRSQVLLPATPPTVASLAHLSPEIEPSSLQLFAHLVPRYFLSELRVAFLEAMILEEEARAMAMQAATTNAEELGHTLARSYRRVRQERITRELLELVAASSAHG